MSRTLHRVVSGVVVPNSAALLTVPLEPGDCHRQPDALD